MKKNILIIGGSSGIGNTIVNNIKEEYNLYVANRSKENSTHEDVAYIKFDATKDKLETSLVPDVLHGLIYCPGSINLKPFKMLKTESFREDMEINFFSLVNVVKTVIPKMTHGASIVLFSTVAVGTGMPFHTSIAAAKGAIEGFAKSLAAEYAPKIRVNVIAPSIVDTPLSKRLLNNDKKRETMANRHPLKRIGNTEDIAYMANFLISNKSSWITGQTIGIDGGLSQLNKG
ncbi:NAD(P)-dependent dehydrogenase (short-subunit alcohol dehydrogenase family) [Maribacter vaceletii]|uniref:NAD(P)-dependent dehydrogenase (Short-subunit alcohol dehydrogenase family) n=1 Tax=Maribacter vaceletii TaxID=1206816 RepID=A0A495E7E6_9FLAO|nr:SDR family oxidoreductase [Maribacter vaceletii]RKR12850.1 NAD(P)-dependent dehydrogenase (short-subunit alcohol dehydrogenase family) [Maribacter vaceletii]